MVKVNLFVAIVASSATSVQSQAASCTLVCTHDAPCVQAAADFSKFPKDKYGIAYEFLKETNRDGWSCECPDNWTGVRCNRPYVRCNGTDHMCFHGGSCYAGLEDKVDVEDLFCDCSKASHNGIPYVGKYCEVEAPIRCGPDSEVFCTFGGSCSDDFENQAHPCECTSGHRGLHCEFDTGHVPECTLQCDNGGQCTLGIKNYETAIYNDYWALHDGNFQYCTCPDGWFDHTCSTQGTPCGSKHCFNGADCVRTLDSDGNTIFTCDCTTAETNEDSFGGVSCQSQSTSWCNKEDSYNGQLFCTNGGMCKENEHEGCNCPIGFHGPICEFSDNELAPECTLQCKNGGYCRKGKKDTDLLKQFGQELSKFNETHLLWEHCVCPDGFFGIQCEHQLEICPGGDHVCLHGAKCVAVDETKENSAQTCDCEGAFDASEKYAGKFCQYSSTDICTINGQPGVGKANFAFCVNNGTCKKRVADNERHPGCNCPEEFTGDHCEFLQNQGSTPEGSPTSTLSAASGSDSSKVYIPNSGLAIGLGIALLILVILVGMTVCRQLRRSHTEAMKEAGLDYGIEKAPNSPAMTEEIVDMQDPDSTEKDLQTVEIL